MYFGVFSGEESVLEKNRVMVIESTLVFNDIVSSPLWHRLACVNTH